MKKKIFVSSGLIAFIDQVIKIMVVKYLAPVSGLTVINNFLYFTYVENTGAAWGIFAGARWLLVTISILAIYAIIKYFLLDETITKIEFVGYILLLGGIIGNLIDRVLYGYVIDYIDIRIGSYHYPVFNLADMVVVIGAGLIIIHLIRNALKQRS
ncbi:MAG: signal peptidase II [Bacilli bacterium]|nr:signal peptidase II [Bacilli bacterium]MDD4298295.1 signal peptidase II [Bacilli bacterium]MDD4644232.1 signal peptidase II [Bacilli bacterium]